VELILCRNYPENHFDFQVQSVKVPYKAKKILQFLQALSFHKIDDTLRMLLDAWVIGRACNDSPEVDIIQSPNYKFLGLFVNHKKARLVVRASSYRPLWEEAPVFTLNAKLTSWLEGRLYQRADAVFAPSKHLAEILSRTFHRQVDVLPSPIPETGIEEDHRFYCEHLAGKKYILFFGSILKRKGIFVLAEAVKQVWTSQPEVLLVLAGPDIHVNGKSNYQRFNALLGENSEKVIYCGNLGQEQLFPVIRNSYFTVSPSLEDNCPNSMLEAMALGKIVLGTSGSSMDEFYPSTCQELLVPRGEVQPLADKLLWLWNLPLERIQFFEQEGKRFVEVHHSLIGSVSALREYYQRILAQS
jgi:glycosyltransferase involved in cell wall biosynthesis